MEKLRNKYIQAIKSADDEDALEAVRLAALGKKGEVSLKMRELGPVSYTHLTLPTTPYV